LKQTGRYTSRSKAAHWDGKNEQGEKAASGVYFYVLKVSSEARATLRESASPRESGTNHFSATRRMIILK
jgi:hypothetical protein